MTNKNEGKKIGVGAEAGREAYEYSVVKRMKGRAGSGSPKGAPGNALEILANDNENLSHIFESDTVTRLTKSSTAKQVDAVTVRANKVIERFQYKDTVSPAGTQKTLNQVKSGKYRQVQLRGTNEATEMYNSAARAKGVSKRMESTGISHKTTQRIGDKCTNQPVKLASLEDAVKGSAAIAFGVTAAIEIGKSVANGDTVGECAGHVVSKGAESVLSAAAATVAAETAASAVGGLLASSAIPVVGPAVAGIGAALLVGGVVSEVTDGVFDEIGDDIGDVVDDIAFGVSDVAFNVSEAIKDVFDIFLLW